MVDPSFPLAYASIILDRNNYGIIIEICKPWCTKLAVWL